jgi:predicted ATPase/DNA-binding SARP family transcriptional activator
MVKELRLSLLGKLHLTSGGQPLTGFVSTKAQALLCFLAVTNRPHDRQTLAALFWGDMPDTEARTSLRTVLTNLRKLVPDHLLIDRDSVAFNPNAPYWLDLEHFQASLAAAGLSESSPSPNYQLPITNYQLLITNPQSPIPNPQSPNLSSPSSIPPLRQAIELYRGDFLEGFNVRDADDFEAWKLNQRDRLHHLAVQALLAFVYELTRQDDFTAALDYTSRLLTLEPWREEAHRLMIFILTKTGQHGAALAQFETCRHLLAEELGVEPAPETQALYERLRAAEAPRPHNLPPQTTPFVGREKELAQLGAYFENPACRLVSLVGLGGVGKTRLALQAAAANLNLFQDGVFFVPLAVANSSEEIIYSIANVLDLPLQGRADPFTQLLTYLKPKELLLTLDNFEYVISTSPEMKRHAAIGLALLTDILQAAPRVKLLATSRERLHLQEEWILEIEGLPYPQPPMTNDQLPITNYQPPPPTFQPSNLPTFQPSNLHPPNSPNSPTHPTPQLHAYSAISFFIQQAERVQPGFTLSAANQDDVIRLCRLLQGIPLGLELAITWLPVLSIGEIAAEIERDLDFLATSIRNIPQRHRSMRAVFESSWSLLSPAEQQLLKQLTVFRDSFQRQAAMQVAGASLPVLLGLLGKSLLRRDAAGRYSMHELIRQYAAEKLAESPPEKEQTEDRFCAYYTEFMAQQEKHLFGPRQLEVIPQIKAELENIRASWRRLVEQKQLKPLNHFIKTLWFFYGMQGRVYEGIEMLTGPIEWLKQDNRDDQEKRQLYGSLLAHQADFYFSLARFAPAIDLWHQSLSLLQSLDTPQHISFILSGLGLVAWHKGEYTQASQYFEEAIIQAKVEDDPWILATSISFLGGVAYALGDYPTAEQRLRQGLAMLRHLDKLWGSIHTLIRLSSVVSVLGRPAEAIQLLHEALALSQQTGERWGVAVSLSRLGLELSLSGDAQQLKAKQLLQQSVSLFREIGDGWGLSNALNRLGRINCTLGDYQAAWPQLREALQVASDNQLWPIVLDTLTSLAELALRTKTNTPASPPITNYPLPITNLQPSNLPTFQTQLTPFELLTITLNHPASQQVAKDRAARLLAEFETELPRSAVQTALAHSKAGQLEAIVTRLLKN